VLLLAPLLIFFVSKCEREKKREKSECECLFWAYGECPPVREPAGLVTFSRLRIYLFILYICLMCVKPRQRRKKKTFYTIGRFLHLLVRVWQTGKHLEKELETASRIFRFIVVLHLFLALNLIGSDRKRVKMLTNNNHIQGREGGKKQKKWELLRQVRCAAHEKATEQQHQSWICNKETTL
jgi:hypothetical protein